MRDEPAVHIEVGGGARGAVELDHGAGAQRQQVVDGHLRAAEFDRGLHLHTAEEVEAFETEEEAVTKANATAYGLAASVWTSSLARAHRVSRRLVAGTVSVNTVDALGLTTPFGGFKQSGFGRDLSLHAFDAYSALKTTWIQHG